jgi:Mg2+-importing ATPase
LERLVLPLSEVTARIETAVWQAIQALIERRPTDGTGQPLLTATPLVVGLTLLLAYSPLAPFLGFVPLPASFLVVMGFVVLLYVLAAEAAKSLFYRIEGRRRETGPADISARPIGISR